MSRYRECHNDTHLCISLVVAISLTPIDAPIHNVVPLVCLCRDQRLQEWTSGSLVWLLHGAIVTQGGRVRGSIIGRTLVKVRASLQFILWRSRSGCITIVLGLPHVHLVADCGALWSLWRVGWPSRGSRKTNLHCILTVD